MQKSKKITLGVCAGVLALGAIGAIAFPTIYRTFFAGPVADTPSLSASEGALEETGEPEGSQSGPIDAAALVGEWTISVGSQAGYRVDEVLNGSDVTVTGRTDDVTGQLTIGEDGLTLDSADFSVDVASIATDSEQRDAYFRDQAMRAEEYPTATFVLTEPVTLESAPNLGDVVQAEVKGELTLAGVTQQVTLDVDLRGTSDGSDVTAEIAGTIPITFKDYGITAPNLGFVSVEDQGSVEFDLVAHQG